jgi:O-antigen chain-terminating bifunctional methyltransferase/kinase
VKLLLDREFRGLTHRLHKFVIRRLIKQLEPYHPVSMEGELIAPGERQCSDRWAVISKVLSEKPDTVLDLGCAEGYFVFRAAQEFGCFTLGVDADVRRLTIAQELNLLNKSDRSGFMYADISPEFLRKLPQFDVVILLAVLHHVMYEHGVEYARDYMKIIRDKTRIALVFEMGQSNEVSMEWARSLPDMGARPVEWIAEFLFSCGFSEVSKAGETDAYQSNCHRGVFVARP